MKKLLPFVFPAVAVLIIIFLAVRWYRSNTQPEGEITPFAEGIEIENLSQSELQNMLQGADDLENVELESSSSNAVGSIRYTIQDERINLSVNAVLPELTEGVYQVWFQDLDGENAQKAFVLELMKGGYIGSAAISTDALPFEVIVSKEVRPDNEVEEVLLQGAVEDKSQENE